MTTGKARPLHEAVLVALLVFLVSISGIAYLTFHARDVQSALVRGDLSRTARSAAGLLDGDAHESVVREGRTGTPEYLRALEPLVRFHQGVPEIAYLYTLIVKDGKLHFVLDTAQASERLGFPREMEASSVLDPYESQSPEEDAAEIAAFFTGADYVSRKPFRDEFGMFLTAVSPVKNSSGQTVALVGVDLNIEDYLIRLQQVEAAALLASAFVGAASLLVGFLVYGFRKRMLIQQGENDFTRAKNAALIDQNRRVVSALGQIVYHYDVAGGVFEWRGDCQKILGRTAAQMPGSPALMRDLMHPKDLTLVDSWDLEETDGEGLLIREFRCLHQMGHEVWILDRAVLQRDDSGRLVAADGVWLDISQRKKFESDLIAARDAAEAAGRAKSDFFAVMSHEIRTPMNGVVGCTNLLLETTLDSQQREYLETIRKCGTSLLDLISDILDFSKMDSDKLSLEARSFSLRDCCGEALNLYAPMAADKNLELVARFIQPDLDWVIGDEARLRQILVNLVGNAIKFTTEGEVVVTFDRRPWLPAGSAVMLSVRDTGIGISDDQQQRIFQPFSQADSSTTRRFGGTGLGLAICGRLATLMGGAITVHSSPGAGSEFVVLIPFAETRRPDPEIDFAALRGRSVTLLVPNRSIADSLANDFGHIGLTVQQARSPEALAREWPAANPPDYVIVDCALANEEMATLIQSVRAGGGISKTKFLALTLPSVTGPSAVNALGFDIRLPKPIRFEVLAVAMRDLIHDRPAPGRVVDPSMADQTFAAKYPLRILIAEDNSTNRKVISHTLKRLGYAPEMVENGRACLEAVQASAFDMILMDVQMPEMDGYEATTALRNAGNSIWITALTADAMPEDPLRCRIAGMNDYLSKPVHMERLRLALEKCALARPRIQGDSLPSASVNEKSRG